MVGGPPNIGEKPPAGPHIGWGGARGNFGPRPLGLGASTRGEHRLRGRGVGTRCGLCFVPPPPLFGTQTIGFSNLGNPGAPSFMAADIFGGGQHCFFFWFCSAPTAVPPLPPRHQGPPVSPGGKSHAFFLPISGGGVLFGLGREGHYWGIFEPLGCWGWLAGWGGPACC